MYKITALVVILVFTPNFEQTACSQIRRSLQVGNSNNYWELTRAGRVLHERQKAKGQYISVLT